MGNIKIYKKHTIKYKYYKNLTKSRRVWKVTEYRSTVKIIKG
jgi:hypothetical protein